MPLSDYFEDALANWLFNAVAYTVPSTFYVSLHTGDPGETGANEVTGLGYVRMGLTRDTNFGAVVAGTGLAPSSTDLVWAPAGAAWGTITYTGLWDLDAGGNFLMGGAVPGTARTIGAGDVFRIGAGNLSVGFA